MSDIAEKNFRNTGFITMPEILINADPTKFDIIDPSGTSHFVVVDRFTNPANPIVEHYFFDDLTAIPATYVTTNAGTWLGFDKSLGGPPFTAANIVQQPEDFTKTQLETIARIGRLSHFGKTVITGTFDLTLMVESDLDESYYIMQNGVLKLNVASLNVSPNGLNLKLDHNGGDTRRIGGGSTRITKNFPTSSSATQFTFIPAWRDTDDSALLSAATTDIDPFYYDDGSGTLQAAGNNQYINLYIYFFPYKAVQTIFQIYGHNEFANLDNAVSALQDDDFFVPTDIRGGILICGISVKRETTQLTTAIAANQARIVQSDNFGNLIK